MAVHYAQKETLANQAGCIPKSLPVRSHAGQLLAIELDVQLTGDQLLRKSFKRLESNRMSLVNQPHGLPNQVAILQAICSPFIRFKIAIRERVFCVRLCAVCVKSDILKQIE